MRVRYLVESQGQKGGHKRRQSRGRRLVWLVEWRSGYRGIWKGSMEIDS